MEDARIIRFFSPDPLHSKYPHNSDYAFSENELTRCIELEGLEKVIYLYNISGSKVSSSKIELETAGKLGDGVAVQLTKEGVSTNFYGKEVQSAEEFTRSYEGLSNARYNDQYGNPTIGYGHLVTDGEDKKYPIGTTISTGEANTLFANDYSEHKDAIIKNLGNASLNQNQKDALVDFGYNTGASKVKKFTPTKGGDFFLGYMKGGAGIQKRRIAESLMFNEGKYLHLDKLGKKDGNTLNSIIKDNTKNAKSNDASSK